jgi:hypothetical protein
MAHRPQSPTTALSTATIAAAELLAASGISASAAAAAGSGAGAGASAGAGAGVGARAAAGESVGAGVAEAGTSVERSMFLTSTAGWRSFRVKRAAVSENPQDDDTREQSKV